MFISSNHAYTFEPIDRVTGIFIFGDGSFDTFIGLREQPGQELLHDG
jgi:hypothetical protein